MKMQNNKILPCPCCASEIKGGVQLTGFGFINKQFIECDDCGLKMETTYSIGGPISQSQLKAITKELITKWNTRKPMERIIDELEECKEDMSHYMDDDIFLGEYNAYKHAIEIVKGGVDNATN